MDYQLYVPTPEGYLSFKKTLSKSVSPKEMSLFESFKKNPGNSTRPIVESRVRSINSLYSTRLLKPVMNEIVDYIINPDNQFDELLKQDYDAVDVLRIKAHSQKKKDGNPVNYLSFATKYCHHCRANKFPIYDNVNVWVLTVLMGYKDKRVYSEFVDCFQAFCKVINRTKLEEDEGFYIDKYMQAIGTGSIHRVE